MVGPPKGLIHTSRFSVLFFMHPVSEVDLTCLDSCMHNEHLKGFEDISVGEFLDKRCKEIGLKV